MVTTGIAFVVGPDATLADATERVAVPIRYIVDGMTGAPRADFTGPDRLVPAIGDPGGCELRDAREGQHSLELHARGDAELREDLM
jgi:hypothetical protein